MLGEVEHVFKPLVLFLGDWDPSLLSFEDLGT